MKSEEKDAGFSFQLFEDALTPFRDEALDPLVATWKQPIFLTKNVRENESLHAVVVASGYTYLADKAIGPLLDSLGINFNQKDIKVIDRISQAGSLNAGRHDVDCEAHTMLLLAVRFDSCFP